MAELVKWYGKKVFTLATKANVEAMNKAVKVVERETKMLLSELGTGKIYRRKRKSGKGYISHRASAKGQPPAVDTGVLRASIMSEATTKGLNIIGRVGSDIDYIAAKADTGTDVEYGLYLEVGTTRMRKRPFLRPALRQTSRKVKELFRRANS